MIVDPKRKIAFIHNPKAAGTSLRTVLLKELKVEDKFRFQGFFKNSRDNSMRMENMSHLDWHMFLRVLYEMYDREEICSPADLTYFGIVRDPFRRFCSAIKEFEIKHHEWWTKFNMPLVDFLWEILTPESIWLPEFSWFKPQMSYFPTGRITETYPVHIIGIEDLNKENLVWAKLGLPPLEIPYLNGKSSEAWLDSLSVEHKNKVRAMCWRLYAQDYDFVSPYTAIDLEPTSIRQLMTDLQSMNNMGSYMWKVRSIQAHKADPQHFGFGPPINDDTQLFAQILSTVPYISNPNTR